MGVDFHIFEVTQTVHTVTRQTNLLAVVPRGFCLAEFAAHDLVTGAIVTHNVDAANIRSTRGVCHQHQLHTVRGPVNFRANFCPCECKTEIAKIFIEGLGRTCHFVSVVGLTRLDFNQRLELIVFAEVIAFHGHFGHHKTIAFCDVDGDADILLVR